MSDPYLVLRLTRDADDEAVHAAYLRAVKACPPERDPQRFEVLRAAYEALRTRRDRLAHDLFDVAPPTLSDIIDRAASVGEPGRPRRDVVNALLRGQD